MPSSLRLTTLVTVSAVLAIGVVPQALAAVKLDIVPHRAVYKLTLAKAGGGASVVGADGTMVLEWSESCTGWEVLQRIKLRLVSRQNRIVNADTLYTSSESKDGTRYMFGTKTLYDGKVHEEFQGRAAMKADGSGGTVFYSVPAGKTRQLEKGTMFPTAHTLHLMRRAVEGKKLDFSKVFDGTSKEGSYRASTVITGPKTPDLKSVQSPLAGKSAWGMRVAFFPDGKNGESPDWELSVSMQRDGISQGLLLDYGDFSVNAEMEKLEPLKRPDC